jgi:DNA-binding response OmpR family regulator
LTGTHFGICFARRKVVPERILIVEDEAVLRKHLARLLVRQGYEVTTAGSCAEARLELNRERFGLLLLDITLPDGDGLSLLATLEDGQRPQQTVVMTAFTTPENEHRALNLDICRVLRKPLDLIELVTAVNRHAAHGGCLMRLCSDADTSPRTCSKRYSFNPNLSSL